MGVKVSQRFIYVPLKYIVIELRLNAIQLCHLDSMIEGMEWLVMKLKITAKCFVVAVSILMITSVFGCTMSVKSTFEPIENDADMLLKTIPKNEDVERAFSNLKFFKTVIGDWAEEGVRFSLGNIAFMDDKVLYNFMEENEEQRLETEIEKNMIRKGIVVSVSFLETNDIRPIGKSPLSHDSNYFIGNEPSEWHKGVKDYERIIYPNIYDNIDLEYYLVDGDLEYDFIVHPDGDPSDIKMHYEGMDSLELEENGILTVQTRFGNFQETRPYIYQGAIANIIEGEFSLQGCAVSFHVGDYDRTQTLVIDPLVYSTYLGGSNFDYQYKGLAIDSSGRPVIAGVAESANFPVTGGGYQTINAGFNDVFVSVMSSDLSTLIHSTYLGGSGYDLAMDMVLDSNGRPAITGYTTSTDFPTSVGAYQTALVGSNDVFVSVLSSDLSALENSTYLGGTGVDLGKGLALDSFDRPIISGYTDSTNFPTTVGAFQTNHAGGTYDVFVSVLSSDLSTLEGSTYLGGSGVGASGSDYMEGGIEVDSNDRPVITGYTRALNFPTTIGAYQPALVGQGDIFVSVLSSDLSILENSTYLGGSSGDEGWDIVLDSSDRAAITGRTSSANFPTTIGAYQTGHAGGTYDGVVCVLSSDLSTLESSTYLGGALDDYGYGLTLDSNGRPMVVGETYSSNFPITSDACQTNLAGNNDVFMSRLSSDLSTLDYSTYLGGLNYDFGRDIVLGSNGRPVISGITQSTDFPTTVGAYQTSHAGGSYDLFVSVLPSISGGPMAVNAYADPNPTNGASSITLYGEFSGSNNVTGAEYFIDVTGNNGTGLSMTPLDGNFNSPAETAYVTINIDALGWLPGEIHTLCVHGIDENNDWGDFKEVVVYVGTQYFLHVETSIGTNMSLLKVAPNEASIMANTTGEMNSAGQYRLGTEAWITDQFSGDTQIGGTWRYFMNGYLTRPATGHLYAKMYDYGTMTLLNPSPAECPTDISDKFSYFEFNWTENISSFTINAGDRIYMELWLNATSSGATSINDTGQGSVIKYGIVSGALENTRTSNDIYQSITEALFNQGGGPNDDYDHLEHGWSFDITGGTSVTFYLEAHQSGASGIENFIFAYSTDLVIFTDMITVTKTADDDAYQTYVMPPGTIGTIYVMVRDSVFNPGTNEVQDTIYIDHIFFASMQPPPEFILGYDNDSTPSRVIVPERTAEIPIAFHIPLHSGWNLVSFPLETASTLVENVLSSIAGKWDVVTYYDTLDHTDPWKTYRVNGTHNDLFALDRTMGFWLHATEACNLTVSGLEPESTTINLYAGWNLVSYPSLNSLSASDALAGTGADMVAEFISTSPYIQDRSDLSSVTMEPGKGYWVRVPANSNWIVGW